MGVMVILQMVASCSPGTFCRNEYKEEEHLNVRSSGRTGTMTVVDVVFPVDLHRLFYSSRASSVSYSGSW